jgi:hypothetical protein
MKNVRCLFLSALVCSLFLSPSIGVAGQDHLKFTRKAPTYSPDLGSETISCTHTPRIEEYFRTYSPHGLSFQSIWLVANVMDETGQKYNLMREYKVTDTTMTLASKEVPGLNSSAEPLFKPGEMFQGRIFHELDKENGVVWVKPFLPDSTAFSVVIRPQHVEWKDADGRIDLVFDALGPALEYYCPGRLEDALYRSEPSYVTGTVNGKAVSGFGVIDGGWGSVGVGFLQGKIYQVLEQNWIVWMNIYEDGSKECGVFVNGVDRFQAFYYNRDGKAMVTRHNKLEPTLTSDGFMKGASITMDDMAFEFVTESRIMQVQSFVSWASGRLINLKEKRKPVKTFAWYEFFPGRKE